MHNGSFDYAQGFSMVSFVFISKVGGDFLATKIVIDLSIFWTKSKTQNPEMELQFRKLFLTFHY